MIRRTLLTAALVVTASAIVAEAGTAQLPEHLRDYPLAQLRPSGDVIGPFFDGWFANPDGTYTYQFGYLNRNTEEVVDIPLGPLNFLEIRHEGHSEPAERLGSGGSAPIPTYPGFDGVQPTRFYVYDRGGLTGKRERGVFAVTVPDAETEVVWTLTHAGHTYAVPGRARDGAYELSWGAAAFGSLRPAIRFSATGAESRGSEGPWAQRIMASVGQPVTISALVQDRGERYGLIEGEDLFVPVRAEFIMHQGPAGAEPMFDPAQVTAEPNVDGSGEGASLTAWGEVSTQATFSEPGDYVIRIRVDNFAAEDSRFDFVCCWSNAYVPVTVR